MIAAMEERPEAEPPARPRRARQKPVLGAPELMVVGPDDAPVAKRPRRRGQALTREDILNAPMDAQPIAGTTLAVRELSVNETDALVDDDANKALDDREFVVRAVARQLTGDPAPGIDEVRAWGDDQLLAGARAMLSFPPLKVTVDGVEQPPDPDENVAMPDPLTFGSFRVAVTAVPKRWESKLAETARRIAELGLPKLTALDSGVMAALKAVQSDHVAAFGQGSAAAQAIESLRANPAFDIAKSPLFDVARSSVALDALRDSPALKMSLPDLDLTRDIAGKARALTDTTGIAAGLSKLQATTLAAERLARPIDVGARIGERALDEPTLVMPAITPYHPEVDAIDALGDRIDAMAQNQARADREALEVMTAQSELIRKQGEAIELVAAEVKGQRNDQRWPNRATYVIAVLTVLLLIAGVLAVYFAYLAVAKV
jgi:hypothetical protein